MAAVKSKSKRIFYFDALRVLAIFAVIACHAGGFFHHTAPSSLTYIFFQTNIWNWIVAEGAAMLKIGVALFLMLSGALSLGRDWDIKSFLKKRLPRIIKPFFFWGFIIGLGSIILILLYPSAMDFFELSSLSFQHILEFFYNIFLSETWMTIPYWFFWMILGTYLFMPVLNKWLKNADLKEAEYFLIIWAIVCVFTYTFETPLPIDLKYFTGPIGYVVLGYYLRHTKRKLLNNKYLALSLTIGMLVLLLISAYLSTTGLKLQSFDRYSILILLEVTGIFLLFKNWGKLGIKSKFLSNKEGIFRKSVASIAKYSYGFYLIHMVILWSFMKLFYKFMIPAILIPISIIFAIAISWLIMAVLNRVPYLNTVIGAK